MILTLASANMIAVCLWVDLAFGLQPYFINNLANVTVMSILASLYPHCKIENEF